LEVEGVILRDSDVLEAISFGVEDEAMGEVVVAVVVMKNDNCQSENDGHGGDEGGNTNPIVNENVSEKLKKWCRSELAPYKVPCEVYVWGNSLPKNAMGKVNKQEMKKLIQSFREKCKN
jgi:malonyl-CoA/methylmalonyl-CoA synthetase